MLTLDWRRRPSAKAIQSHPFFENPSPKPLHDLARKLKQQVDARARWRKLRTYVSIGKKLKEGGKAYRRRKNRLTKKRENAARKLRQELSVLF